jgi:uncharacterized protein (DUF2147 family)
MLGKTLVFTSAVVVLAVSAADGAPSVAGDWRTPDRGGVVNITTCGDALCGRIVTSDLIKANPALSDVKNPDPSLRGRRLQGLTLFYGGKGGPTVWDGGSIYNPDDGRTYHASIKLKGEDALSLTGCVVSPICSSQTWTRVR